jgi:hypothetical protein
VYTQLPFDVIQYLCYIRKYEDETRHTITQTQFRTEEPTFYDDVAKCIQIVLQMALFSCLLSLQIFISFSLVFVVALVPTCDLDGLPNNVSSALVNSCALYLRSVVSINKHKHHL